MKNVFLIAFYLFFSFSSTFPNNLSLKVGVTAGPHAIIVNHIKEQAEKENFKIDIIEFNDFILPNAALDQGDIDLNSYQHEPFLKDQVTNRGYKIQSVGKTVLMPMSIYSNKVKNLEKVETGVKVGIPNDPTNSSRALFLLKQAGLITLKDNSSTSSNFIHSFLQKIGLMSEEPQKDQSSQQFNPTIHDIDQNPKQLIIIELEAPQLPRSLDDLDLAVINTDWVILSNMDPKTALYTEDAQSSVYTNVIAVKQENINSPAVKRFVELYHSNNTKDFIEKTFKGALVMEK